MVHTWQCTRDFSHPRNRGQTNVQDVLEREPYKAGGGVWRAESLVAD